ncbi:hypothetical protein EDD22DRAFT_847902 [Suillus occidentalis]|nr:hypothetical protein EDD22DRAFT_847902 [Suillus occidentalis]
MNTQIKDGELELSMFGSSFFVLEGKGIKFITKDSQRGRFQGPEEALLYNLPDLDWHYMMNRNHGELLVDVGISFTPHSSDIPVAEMQRERSQQTHIGFWSAYNLYYEAVRTTNNQVSFALDSDVYKTTLNYMTECFNIERVLAGSKDKTYGVRDEYRTSGKAARLILANILSNAYCHWVARQTSICDQIQCFGYHLTCGLGSWRDVNMVETAGMFFMQEFDLRSDTCLYDVQQQDDITVLALMGANTKSQRARTAARLEMSRADVESESKEFPIGWRPSWARLKSAVESSL